MSTCRVLREYGFCLLCYANRRGRENNRGHWGYKRPRKSPVWRDWAMKRRTQDRSVVGNATLGDDWRAWAKQHPCLAEHLADHVFDDGTVRITSTLTVFVEDGKVKLCLRDREEDATAWVSGTSLAAALKAMEQLLRDGSIDWRPSGGGAAKASRGKKA